MASSWVFKAIMPKRSDNAKKGTKASISFNTTLFLRNQTHNNAHTGIITAADFESNEKTNNNIANNHIRPVRSLFIKRT
ncbi:MAG: hypothetical protein BWY70_01823 [Bacteroidetes bacterium ADurb.Bin408]|nr:MAG: hypothetical protein BWY70_01823 [Bacteroidetes bacterium ADurb.Bin408]